MRPTSPHPIFAALTLSAFLTGVQASEQDDLALALQHLHLIDQIAERSSASNTASARYSFDYPRLREDLTRVRRGIDAYLSPARAQPRDQYLIEGDYQIDGLREVTP